MDVYGEDESTLIDNLYPPFYLKHIIENDILKESYLVFVITPKMKQQSPEMKIGNYEMKGNDENSYEANKEIIKEAFGYATNPSRCRENNNSFSCTTTNYTVIVAKDGSVEAHLSWYACRIGNNGTSGYCYFLGF